MTYSQRDVTDDSVERFLRRKLSKKEPFSSEGLPAGPGPRPAANNVMACRASAAMAGVPAGREGRRAGQDVVRGSHATQPAERKRGRGDVSRPYAGKKTVIVSEKIQEFFPVFSRKYNFLFFRVFRRACRIGIFPEYKP